MKKVVVIGAGAAGMMAAATAANRGLDVTLIEKNHRVGRKILITGKGRCNITNDCDIEELIENVPTNGKFLYSAFYTFTNTDVIDMFNKLGVETKTERGKRVFPSSDKAHDIANALEKMIKSQKVKLLLNTKVDKVVSKGSKIEKVILDNKKELKKVSEGDDVMDKVNEKICKLSDDEILQGIYVKEEMDSWMKKLDLKYAKEEGKKEANMETARKLLKKGMEIKDIIDITGITEKQIEILRKSL